MADNKDKKLEDITREEFENSMDLQLESIQDQYSQLVKMYNKYQRDKQIYSLSYCKKDGILYYVKNPKRKIGYVQDNK